MNETKEKILALLLKGIMLSPTITSLADSACLTRQGAWKLIKDMEKEGLVTVTPFGTSKTSALIIKLNWSNLLTEKTLSLILAKEASKKPRWLANFEELKDFVRFLILFGSILTNPKEANDIDLIAAVDSAHFKKIENIVARIQLAQERKIHLIAMLPAELEKELRNQNKAYMDAVKKGVILFGHDHFVRFMESSLK